MGIIKTKDEIKKLKKAANLGDACFSYICSYIKIGMTEKEIAREIDSYMLRNGAEKMAFDTIVGSGENSAQIHSTPTDRIIQDGDIILLDFGCVLNGCCSDMSRTIFISYIKDEYKEVYDIVLRAQLEAINKIKIGMRGLEADKISRDIINSYGYDFNHAVGHGIGKIVHEEPKISIKSEDIIKNNMAFSIEPGIYIEDKFGIRIEDVVVMQGR